MKTIGLIIAMLFSVTSWGATPAKVSTMTLGNRTITSTANIEVLTCNTLNEATSCMKDGVINWTVPVGFQFRIIGITCWVNGTAFDQAAIGYHNAGLFNNAPTGTAFGVAAGSPGNVYNNMFGCQVQGTAGANLVKENFSYYWGGDDPAADKTKGWIVPNGNIVWFDGTNASNYKGGLIYGILETP